MARGIAVLGVLLMNIWAFAGPQAFFDYPVAAKQSYDYYCAMKMVSRSVATAIMIIPVVENSIRA